MNPLERPSNSPAKPRVTRQFGKSAWKAIPTAASQRFGAISIPEYPAAWPSQDFFRLRVSATHRMEHLGKPCDHGTSQHPRRNFPAASRNQRRVEKLGRGVPSDFAQHASHPGPSKARPYNEAADDLVGLGRAKGDRARASARDQANGRAFGTGRKLRPDVERTERRFVHSQKGFRKWTPSSAPLRRREDVGTHRQGAPVIDGR